MLFLILCDLAKRFLKPSTRQTKEPEVLDKRLVDNQYANNLKTAYEREEDQNAELRAFYNELNSGHTNNETLKEQVTTDANRGHKRPLSDNDDSEIDSKRIKVSQSSRK